MSASKWPKGWTCPAPLFNPFTGDYEPFPPQWIGQNRVKKEDILALAAAQKTKKKPYFDPLSAVGKKDPNWTSMKKERQAEFKRLRELHRTF